MGRGTKYTWWRRRIDRVAGAAFGSGWGARAAFLLRLQGRLVVVEHEFEIPGMLVGSEIRVAFASDFHAGPLTDRRLFERLAAAVVQFRPDLLLLGGDYVSLDARHIHELLGPLSLIRPTVGAFGVLGNHDLWLDDAFVVEALQRAGVDVLVNESRRLNTPGGPVRLYGMDEPNTGQPQPPDWPGEPGPSLVLMHSPLGVDVLRNTKFDLALCGHTHGGQVALPGGVPVVLPRGSGDRRHARGEFRLPGTESRMVVSRGVGMSGLPVRLFAPSEVHLCVLRSERIRKAA